MVESHLHGPVGPLSPARKLAGLAALLLPLVVLGGAVLAPAQHGAAGPAAIFAAGAAVAIWRIRTSYPHASLGACNAVTAIRAALAITLVAPILVPEAVAAHRGAIVALAALALALDGVDGWLARRAGLVSDFGARFDMEVDCILAAILALLLLRTVDGAFVVPALLVLGFARYAFVVAAWMWPWLRGDLPDRISRKAVCVAQIGALIAVLAMPALAPILPLAALAVLWSFARDVRWLARRR